MADLAYTTMQWRTLSFGRGTSFRFNPDGLAGWSGLPPNRKDKQPRAGGHGNQATGSWHNGRTVMVAGFVEATTSRDTLVKQFRDVMVPADDPYITEALTISHAGETLTAFGQLVQADIDPGSMWGQGRFGWKAQFECDDPLRYGPEISATSFLQAAGTGLALPLALPAAFPANPVGGSLQVTNLGAALAPAVFVIRGDVAAPQLLLNAATPYQRLISYGFNLATDEFLTIDTRTGQSTIGGSFRLPLPDSDVVDDLRLRPGLNTIQVLGAPGVGTPAVTVTFRSASW